MDKLTSLDLTNLNFLIKSDAETLAEFYDTASDEDIVYALELIRWAIRENTKELDQLIDTVVTNTSEYAEANAVLAKFRLAK